MQKSVTDTTLILPVIQTNTIYENFVTYQSVYEIQHKTTAIVYAEGVFSEFSASLLERDQQAIAKRQLGQVMTILENQHWQWLQRPGVYGYATGEVGPWLNRWRAVQLDTLRWRFYHPLDDTQFYNVDFLAGEIVNGWPTLRARLAALMGVDTLTNVALWDVVPQPPRWGYAELDGADVDLSCEDVGATGYQWHDDTVGLVGSAAVATDTVTLDPGTYNIRAMASHTGVYSFLTYPTQVTVPEPTP